MTSKYRMEHDSLGKVRVPRQALYGAQTARAVENYPISGRQAHPALIRAYLKLKRAAAVANASDRVISKRQATLIVRAVDKLLSMHESKWPEIFPVDPYQAGAGTSQNMNINEVVANLGNKIAGKKLGANSPLHPNDHVNRSQSTNDTFPTAMRLALLGASKQLLAELKLISKSFSRKANQWMDVPKSARTHLQDAVPIRLGQEIGAYAAAINRAATWLAAGRNELRELGIGGSAAGTGLTVPAQFRKRIIAELSRLTGERLRPATDLCEAMQSQSPVMFYSSMLRLTALELTRICNDLRLLASGPMTGLAELTLPAVQPGSSIMPGKVNPSILEMANQTWFSVIGFDQTIALATQAGQLELNVMMPIMAYSSLEATKIMTNALTILRTRCIDGLEPNLRRLRQYFEVTPQVATVLSPELGYENTAKLVKESLECGRSVIELVKERNLISTKELERLLNLELLTGRPRGSRSRG